MISPYIGLESIVGVMGSVAEGNGVKVGVGGNHTVVPVGVMVGGREVSFCIGIEDCVAIGKQAALIIIIRMAKRMRRIHFIALVYYGSLKI